MGEWRSMNQSHGVFGMECDVSLIHMAVFRTITGCLSRARTITGCLSRARTITGCLSHARTITGCLSCALTNAGCCQSLVCIM